MGSRRLVVLVQYIGYHDLQTCLTSFHWALWKRESTRPKYRWGWNSRATLWKLLVTYKSTMKGFNLYQTLVWTEQGCGIRNGVSHYEQVI
jgi:hypothetical protein